MTDQAFPKLTKFEDIFKDLVWENLISATLEAYHLNNWFVSGIVHIFTDKLYEVARKVIDLQAIAFVSHEHRKAFDIEYLKLKVVAVEKGIESDEFKQENERAKADLARFVRRAGTT